MALTFDRRFEPRRGAPVPVAPQVVRITANNPGPFTFHGTNSYLVGEDGLAIIDPGPDDEAHLAALLGALDGRRLGHIFVSHTHIDHSPLAAELARRTGAKVLATGPHRPARPLHMGEINPLDVSADTAFSPDRTFADGEIVQGDGWRIRCVATPGHTANHACFALEDTGILFSADHVMAWSTSIVAPPDGSMSDYMASLEKLQAREDRIYLPGHGGPVLDSKAFVRELKAHRKGREAAILDRLAKGYRTVPALVEAIYEDLDPVLRGAAALSVFAHLEDLVARGAVLSAGDPSLDGDYEIA